jgi:hypothetical protein
MVALVVFFVILAFSIKFVTGYSTVQNSWVLLTILLTEAVVAFVIWNTLSENSASVLAIQILGITRSGFKIIASLTFPNSQQEVFSDLK